MNESLSLMWAKKQLEQGEYGVVKSFEKLVDTSYSIVFRLICSFGECYLKVTHPGLYLAPFIYRLAADKRIDYVPSLVASNDELHCFIISSCGESTLRDKMDGSLDTSLLKQGIDHYLFAVEALSGDISVLLGGGVHDLRMFCFAEKYSNLIGNIAMLQDDGISDVELQYLDTVKPNVAEICNRIGRLGLNDSLCHWDFHDNNLVYSDSGKVGVIDWGEVVVTHPLFPLCGFMWSLVYSHGVDEQSEVYSEILNYWLGHYQSILDGNCLKELYSLVDSLNGVYAAMGYSNMYHATESFDRPVSQTKRGSIAGCLRTFMNKMKSADNEI